MSPTTIQQQKTLIFVEYLMKTIIEIWGDCDGVCTQNKSTFTTTGYDKLKVTVELEN